jgi:AcrR family transcriptional regulator
MADVVQPRPAPASHAGRPRNAALDDEILAAVRDLLVERGYQALSIQEVTRRTGVHVRTINRRWSTKAALIAAAVLGGDEQLFDREVDPVPPTGHLRADLRRLLEINVQYLADPATRVGLPALVSEIATDDHVRALFERRTAEWTTAIQGVLESAVASGDAPARVLDRVRLLPSVLTGTSFDLQWTHQAPVDDPLLDELVDFVMAALLAEQP